jgi:Zn-dependent peptidase ImmA (M78 family)
VRTEYFFRPMTVKLDRIEYRKRGNLPRKRLKAIENEVTDQIERRLELENLFPSPPGKTFAPVGHLPDKVAELPQIEDLADAVREAWNLGFDPIPDLIDLFETQGIRVFRLDLKGLDPEFDGLAAKAGELPILAVASHWPGDRQRFTLAHELGHLMLAGRLTEGLDEERACNRFAGALLAPRSALLRELGPHRTSIEPKELALLKEQFGLSMAGLLYRAQELGIVSAAWRAEQIQLFQQKGWNITEPGKPYPAEKAHVFEQLVFHALAEGYIGESKAAELLKLSLNDLRATRELERSDAAGL